MNVSDWFLGETITGIVAQEFTYKTGDKKDNHCVLIQYMPPGSNDHEDIVELIITKSAAKGLMIDLGKLL